MIAVYIWLGILTFDLGRRELAQSDRWMAFCAFIASATFWLVGLSELALSLMGGDA
jgi:hypothetical protein